MRARNLLIVTALAEAPLGIMLMLSPSMISGLLLGVSLDATAAIVGRVAGAALFALGIASWLARDDGLSPAARGLVAALMLYNCATIAILAHAAITGLTGILLWPAAALHVALALWCGACSANASRPLLKTH